MPKKRKRKRGKKKLLFLRKPKDQRSVEGEEDGVREVILRLQMKKIPIWRFLCLILFTFCLFIFYSKISYECRVKTQFSCYFHVCYDM